MVALPDLPRTRDIHIEAVRKTGSQVQGIISHAALPAIHLSFQFTDSLIRHSQFEISLYFPSSWKYHAPNSMTEAPKQILDLVERFDTHTESYKSASYNEAQLRQEFLNPFFESLGWDVTNKKGYAEAYKDVIHEDAIKVGSTTKAPDYCFRLGGVRKFFVEAKKPSSVWWNGCGARK